MKFIILKKASINKKERLEFYPSERRYRDGCKAERIIFISEILSVEKTKHPNHHFVFTIFLKSEKLRLVADFPDQRDSWIEAISHVKNHAEKDHARYGMSV